MARKARTAEIETPLPICTTDDHAECDRLALRVMHYLPDSELPTPCACGVPRDIIGTDGKTVILWRTPAEGNYSFHGWEPWHDGLSGGRYDRLASALGWVDQARGIRAGKDKHF